jgi:hypothetical protein
MSVGSNQRGVSCLHHAPQLSTVGEGIAASVRTWDANRKIIEVVDAPKHRQAGPPSPNAASHHLNPTASLRRRLSQLSLHAESTEPPRPVVIFDCDGTLLDTEPAYLEAESAIAAAHGGVTLEQFKVRRSQLRRAHDSRSVPERRRGAFSATWRPSQHGGGVAPGRTVMHEATQRLLHHRQPGRGTTRADPSAAFGVLESLEGLARAAARLCLAEVSAGWVSPYSRGLCGGAALLL